MNIPIDGRVLKAARSLRRLSLRELSQRSGVAYQVLWRYETERQKAEPESLRRLAKALDVDPEDLVAKGQLFATALRVYLGPRALPMTKDGDVFRICAPERDLIPRRGALRLHTQIRLDVPENFVFMATGTQELAARGILADACIQPGRGRPLDLTIIGSGTESYLIDRGEDIARGCLVPCVPARALQLRGDREEERT